MSQSCLLQSARLRCLERSSQLVSHLWSSAEDVMPTPSRQNSCCLTFLRGMYDTHSSRASDATPPALLALLTAEVKLHLTPPTPFIRPQGFSVAWQTLSVLSLTGRVMCQVLLSVVGLRCCGCLATGVSVCPSREGQQGHR